MNSYPIGPLTGSLKPRYNVISATLGLDTLGNNVSAGGFDVFIDLNTLFKASASSTKFMNSLPYSSNVETDIIGGVLMTLKHWRDYTRRFNNTRIFMLFNDMENTCICEREQLKSYMIPYENKYQGDRYKTLLYYWDEAIKRLEIIFKYLPSMYLIRCKNIDAFIVPELLRNPKSHRIVISGNSLFTNYTYTENTTVFYSRFRANGMTQVSDPLMIVQSMTKIDDEVMNTFIKNKVFYNTLQCIIGNVDRGLIGLTQLGITGFAQNLLRSLEKHRIPSDPKSIESILTVVDPSYHDYLRKTYPLVDIESHRDMIKKSVIEKLKSDCLVDLYDIDSLKAISVEGLNLLELL